ncbi:MAG: M48 family peptidase, partial [Pseudomonadota bacterium]
MNTFSYIFILCLSASIVTQWVLVKRHIKHIRANREQVPADFTDKIPTESHHKAADYTQAKVRTGLAELIVGSAIILLWTLGGGLQFLDNYVRSLGLSEIYSGTLFILSVFLISAIIDIPMELYRTFKLEQTFGFNKMT